MEGDWSNAAFWLAADAISPNTVTLTGMNSSSPQGDRAVKGFIDDIRRGSCVIDAKDTPDIVPILAVVASVSEGTTEIINAGRLRIKESDRLKATAEMLSILGADIEEKPEGLVIKGRPSLNGGRVSSSNDHRMAMSAAIASIACRDKVIIDGAEAVNKSYPAFWEDFRALGGKVELI